MRTILFERKIINSGTAGNAFQKKFDGERLSNLTVNGYQSTFCIQTDGQQMQLRL